MKRPGPEVVKAIATMSRQYPEIARWIGDWYGAELEQLPSVTGNVTLAQGRCQVLKELHNLIQKSPDYAAESKR